MTGGEAVVAVASLPARGSQPALPVCRKIGQHFPTLGPYGGSHRHLHHRVVARCAVATLALAVGSISGPPMGVVFERDQRGHIVVGYQPDAAAVAAVAAVGSAFGHMGLTAKRDAPGTAVAAPHVQAALVYELGHRLSIRTRLSQAAVSRWETISRG